jgi:hypothetical protein
MGGMRAYRIESRIRNAGRQDPLEVLGINETGKETET